MKPALALRRAFNAITTEGALPTYDDLLEQFGSNAGIAAAAGLTDPKTTERKTFMRNLQRYASGTRTAAPAQLEELARRVGRDVGQPVSIEDAVAEMRERGMSFIRLRGEMDVSSEKGRVRDVPSSRGGALHIPAELLTASLSDLTDGDYEGEEDEDGEPVRGSGASFLDLVEAHRWKAAVPLFIQAVLVKGYGMPGGVSLGDLTDLQIGVPQ